MGWKNCIKCGRLYREGDSGCGNAVCLLFRQGDEAQQRSLKKNDSISKPKPTGAVSIPQRGLPMVKNAAAVPSIDLPEKISILKVSPPTTVPIPKTVESSHVLPVIVSVEGDSLGRTGGSIDVRQSLIDLKGHSVSALVPGLLTKLGKGVNKQVYSVKNAPWVVAVITAGEGGAKWRAVTAEIDQLMALLKAGVTVPSLGPVSSAKDALIDVQTEDGQPAKAFIEERIVGKHDLCRQESHDYAKKFADEIERVIGGRKAFDLERWQHAKADLEMLKAYFDKGKDIPDFQIVVEEATGHVYTIDPGDPALTGAVLSKHKGWVDEWLKVIAVLKPRTI